MRIDGWRVDGFGVLAGHEVSGLAPGLTVVLGPNESGKSTLLEFVRGVLVGFPDARRRLPRHEPVHGGRHGGALRLVDDAGRLVLLERFVGARQPVAVAPFDDAAAAAELVAQLAAVDAAVFRSVFAFGLDELRGLGALTGDDLKDLLFSAGVTGAGRSATAALRVLSDERGKIVRARHAEARANRAHKQLQDVERALRAAREEARRYPLELAALDRLAGEVDRSREALEAARARAARLERLAALWPVWRRREEAAGQLAAADAGGAPPDDPVLGSAPRIRSLAAQLSGHEARLERLDELERSRAGLLERLAELREQLGPGWDEDRAGALDASIVSLDAVRGHARALDQASDAVAFQAARVREAAAAADAAGARAPAAAGAPRATGEIDAERRAVRTARGLLAEEERRRGERGQAAGPPPAAARSRTLPAALALAALAAGAGAAAAALGHRPELAAFCLALLAAAALAGAVALLPAAGGARAARHGGRSAGPRRGNAPSRPPAPPAVRGSPASDGGARPADAPADADDALAARLATVADRLGTVPPLRAADLDEREVALDAEWQERIRHDEAARARSEAEAALEREHRSLQAAEGRLEDARASWRRWTDARGLPPASPEAVEELLKAAGAAAGKVEALGRVDGEIARTRATLSEYVRLVDEVAALAGQPGVAGGRDPRAVLAQLQARLSAAGEVREHRDALRATLAACDEQLGDLLGSGAEAEARRAELQQGDVAGWEAERARLAPRLAELAGTHEAAVRAHQDQARQLEALGSSGSIARLEMDRAGLEEELRVELREWWILGLAKGLIEETLARYERERQPAVVARAAELFTTVTDGRYRHLLPRGEREGGRDQSVDVVDRAGRRLEATVLSRGTVEQLYLCLRLALAEVFAARTVSLPFVLDDVLVNFDPERAGAVVEVLRQVAERHQVLLFTCHPHLAALAGAGGRGVGLVELGRPAAGAPAPHAPAYG